MTKTELSRDFEQSGCHENNPNANLLSEGRSCGVSTCQPLTPFLQTLDTTRTSIPVGHWRDSLWDIFRYGYCHTSVLQSCCCTLLAVGQVATRLQLDVWGKPTASATLAVFRKLLYTTMIYWSARTFLLIIIGLLDPNVGTVEWMEPPLSYYFACGVDDAVYFVYLAYMVVVLKNARSHLRQKYAIPEQNQCPSGMEDTCCSLLCPCFVAGQMLRHTADYDEHRGRCCSATGLPASAPSIV